MIALKVFIATVFLVGVNCRTINYYTLPQMLYLDDGTIITSDDLDDVVLDTSFETEEEPNHLRVRRQSGSLKLNSDFTADLNGRIPLAGNDKNRLSAIAGVNGIESINKVGGVSGGLLLENANRHALSVTAKHMPGKGNQLTGAGQLNLFHNDRHDLNANAFVSRTMPTVPNVPNFTTKGAGIDYTFNNKVGASLGMAHTDLFKQTDYSAMGNLNLYRTPTSSFDFHTGVTKSVSPFIPNSSWQPSTGFSFSKYF